MVRILKVKELEARKRLLLTQSEMYRQTMRLEIANVKYSAALLQRKLRFIKPTLAGLERDVALAMRTLCAFVDRSLSGRRIARQSRRAGRW